jgi:hypothetical protein
VGPRERLRYRDDPVVRLLALGQPAAVRPRSANQPRILRAPRLPYSVAHPPDAFGGSSRRRPSCYRRTGWPCAWLGGHHSRLPRPTRYDAEHQLKRKGAKADESAIFDAIEKNLRLILSEVELTKKTRALKKRGLRSLQRPRRSGPARSVQHAVDTDEECLDHLRLPAGLGDLR